MSTYLSTRAAASSAVSASMSSSPHHDDELVRCSHFTDHRGLLRVTSHSGIRRLFLFASRRLGAPAVGAHRQVTTIGVLKVCALDTAGWTHHEIATRRSACT